MTDYLCASCRVPTDKGAVVCYPDETVIIPLCPSHMTAVAQLFREDGVPVVSAEKQN